MTGTGGAGRRAGPRQVLQIRQLGMSDDFLMLLNIAFNINLIRLECCVFESDAAL